MGKKKRMPREALASQAKPNRSPSWILYARIDPDLEARVQAYRDSHEYPPDLARIVERALKMLLQSKGF